MDTSTVINIYSSLRSKTKSKHEIKINNLNNNNQHSIIVITTKLSYTPHNNKNKTLLYKVQCTLI